MSEQRRIYVACLTSYNNGDLYGEWIDATQDADDIRADIAKMLRGSKYPNVEVDCPECGGSGLGKFPLHDAADSFEACPHCKGKKKVPSAEEWAIHDYEGFEGVKLSESASIDKVAELAAALDEHADAYAAYLHYVDASDASVEDFQDKYSGTYDRKEDYAEELVEQGYADAIKQLPDFIKFNIDYAGIVHDMEVGGNCYFVERGGKVYVFTR